MKKESDTTTLAQFIYETGILNRTPRSGLWFLGSGNQSVAEHLYRTAMIAYVLCHMTPKANRDRVLFMSMVHDFGEARTSDHNYVHQRYGRLAEAEALGDLAETVPIGRDILDAYNEEQARETLEAKLVKDADVLEWIAILREEEVKGNTKARTWAEIAEKRLKTTAGKKIGNALMCTHPDSWWFDSNDEWFVTRKENARKRKPAP